MAELQKDYLELQQEYAKLNNKHKHRLAWGWKRIRTSTLFHRKAEIQPSANFQNRICHEDFLLQKVKAIGRSDYEYGEGFGEVLRSLIWGFRKGSNWSFPSRTSRQLGTSLIGGVVLMVIPPLETVAGVAPAPDSQFGIFTGDYRPEQLAELPDPIVLQSSD
ncbi:hypothetical protein LINPERHAP1_LOCUS33553 [Linum perenne]